MTIKSDIQLLSPGTLVELFEVDATAIGGSILRWHSGVNSLGNNVVWQGNTYTRFPIEADGFEQIGTSSIPRPTLRAANTTGLVAALVRDFDDMVNAKVTRRRTLLKYLDAVNFPGGVNPTADPNSHFADEIYYIDRKSRENRLLVEFELSAAWDIQGVELPRRHVIQNVCPWVYRSAECTYTGGPVADINDVATADPNVDACGKRLKSCSLRFGTTAILPFGGFPGAGLFRT